MAVHLIPRGERWEVAHDFTVGKLVVTEGFTTNLASTPRILWPLFPPFGRYTVAAVVHDFLYWYSEDVPHTRKEADQLFYRMMLLGGTRRWRAWLMYAVVRVFGGPRWKKNDT